MKCAIIGGSIAGCAMAQLLVQQGHHVRVFERSSGMLAVRGNGILMPHGLVQQLKDTGLIESHFEGIALKSSSFYVLDQGQERNLYTLPFNASALYWGELYRQLRQGLEDGCYYSAAPIEQVRMYKAHGSLYYKDVWRDFDLIIGADGAQSLCRSLLFPQVKRQDAGYILWRGVLDIDSTDLPQQYRHARPVYIYPHGHLLAYPIPCVGFNQTERMTYNWVLYQTIESMEIALPESLYQLNVTYQQYVAQLAQQYFPVWMQDLIARTSSLSIQKVEEYCVPKNYQQRLCLLGDAASLLRPHAASGTANALQAALSLAKCIGDNANVDEALLQWDTPNTQRSQRLSQLSVTLGNVLVTAQPDWKNMSTEQVEAMFLDIIKRYQWYVA